MVPSIVICSQIMNGKRYSETAKQIWVMRNSQKGIRKFIVNSILFLVLYIHEVFYD
jgi:hypothetical protein